MLAPEILAGLLATEIPEQRKLYQGSAHRCLQRLDEAQRDFDEAGQLASSLPPLYTCQLLIVRASLEIDQKHFDRAASDYSRALALSRAHSLRTLEAAALADSARLATLQGRFDQALDLYSAALQLAQSLKMQGNIATILGNLGWSYFELGDFDASLDFYRSGAESSAQDGLAGYSAYWFSGVASAYMAMRDYSSAEKLALDTLAKAEQLQHAETVTASLNTLADVMLRTGRLDQAQRYNQQALRFERSGQDKFGIPDSTLLAGKIAEAQGRLRDATALFTGISRDPNADPPLRWAAQSGLAKVSDDQNSPLEAEKFYRQAIETIELTRQSINHDELRLSFLSSGIAVYGDYIGFLVRRGRVRDALLQADLSRARTLAEGLSSNTAASRAQPPGSPDPQSLAARLHSTILTYWLGEKHSYLWASASGKTEIFLLPPVAEIESLVKSYRKAQTEGRDVLQSSQAEGQKLYQILVAPARKSIPPNSRVIILPDAALYSLNFETLIVPGPQPHFWIEDAAISVANSLALLSARAAHPAPKKRSLLLIGDTLQATSEFPALTQAPQEMALVQRYFPETPRLVLAKQQATPSAYLASHPEQYAYLHFVTHGIASRARPLESAVVLSPQEDAYKLYARDILARRLSAELVTISACNGSGTRAYSGEGLVGLSWAFLRAGAHNVIGALWEVSDTATPQLMDKLYSGIAAGQDPAAALRNAKLSFLHSGNVYAKPFYWAPFQLYSGS